MLPYLQLVVRPVLNGSSESSELGKRIGEEGQISAEFVRAGLRARRTEEQEEEDYLEKPVCPINELVPKLKIKIRFKTHSLTSEAFRFFLPSSFHPSFTYYLFHNHLLSIYKFS